MPANAADGFAPRLALFYAGIFVAIGVELPFFPVWLAAKELDPRAIGIILAVPMVVRIAAVPVATRIADRTGALRGILIAAAVGTAAGCALLGLVSGFWLIFFAVALAATAFAPALPLADAYALSGLRSRGRAYGPVRLWGSAAFIAGNLGAGMLVDVLAPRDLIWMIFVAFAAAAAASLALAPVGGEEPKRTDAPPPLGKLLRAPGFFAVVVGASLIQASHAVYYAFSALSWKAMGLSGTVIGALWALGVVAEIVLFAFNRRLPGPLALLVFGAAGAAIRWVAMAFDPPALLLPALQCLHALSFGASHLGAVQFLARAAPEGLGATAQGSLSVALGVVMAAALGLSGTLYDMLGALAYLVMVAAASAGGLFVLAARRGSSDTAHRDA